MKSGTESYLRSYAIPPTRPLVASSVEDFDQAVVIPALAEKFSLFRTLASLSRNPACDLHHTLVVCVVNNHRPNIAAEEEIRDNQETLQLLFAIVFGGLTTLPRHRELQEDLHRIAESDLRLAFIDASSPGSEIPDGDGGVGTARKIGMDAVLRLIHRAGVEKGVICCLDADTLVEENYLSAICTRLHESGNPAAVVAYAHQKPDDPELQEAICCYEIFLRYYVMGLTYAGSPYAFHAIGSTMACTTVGYVGVRGMNRRTAAEDFHFLNKLAKIGKIGIITETTVFPSSRISGRVPFGTGRRMLQHLTGATDQYRLYDPRVFVIIREWFAAMEDDPDRDPKQIFAEAGQIHPSLAEYLCQSNLEADWRNIRRNSQDPGHLRRQFHVWLDGLKTLRLVHHLSRQAFPLVPLFDGLTGLIDFIDRPLVLEGLSPSAAGIDIHYRTLEALRAGFPLS